MNSIPIRAGKEQVECLIFNKPMGSNQVIRRQVRRLLHYHTGMSASGTIAAIPAPTAHPTTAAIVPLIAI